jgi:ABC-type glucose/galactose transport system permease subunit
MSKLTVVYLKDTGHVLAALTRADPPAADQPVGALVNKGLSVSAVDTTAADITVPVANLASVTVDDNQPEVLTSPQNFQVVQDPQGQAPPQVKNVGVAGSTVSVALDHTSGATVTVTNVPSATTLPAVVVFQKITSPSLPPTILTPVNITVGLSGTVVCDQTGFVAGDKWNVYAFVQTLVPKASPALAVT